jgi:DNA processing protein
MRDDELRIAVTLATMPGDESIHRMIAEFGIQAAAERWSTGDGPKAFCEHWERAKQQAPRVLERALSSGYRYILPGDSEWPVQLDVLDELMPIGLWVRGKADLAKISEKAISIVGARSSTSYGERIASTIASQAAGIKVTVISGAAYGIDAAAHRGALANDGFTIAVLACGVDYAYPKSHDTLLARIAENGLIISEHVPGEAPRKPGFLVRNRLIAALGSSTVVVEAALRSGTLSTSTWANDIGRQVWGVPGQISSPTSAGVHVGIAQGAMKLLANTKDPLREFAVPKLNIGQTEKTVLNLVLGSRLTTDELVQLLHRQIAPSEVIAALALLEFSGLVVRQSNYWLQAS